MRFRLLMVAVLLISLASLAACGAGWPSNPLSAPVSHAAERSETATGQELFKGTCAACHGPSAEGITGLGPNLIRSAFMGDTSDEDLLAFIKRGRPVDDPANTTGVPMPARGGNQSLNDEELLDIIAYLRSHHQR